MKNEDDDDVEYELVEVHVLPKIDIRRSLKSVLFTKHQAKILNRFLRAVMPLCIVIYPLALPIGVLVMLLPPSISKWLAFAELLFALPLSVQGVLSLRVDLLRCLVRTYEFWFFLILHALKCVVFAMYLGDLRMIILISHWIGIQLNNCIDANLTAARHLASISPLAIIYYSFILVAVSFRLIPDTHDFLLITIPRRHMLASEFLGNAFATILVLLLRTAYRKRYYLKWTASHPVVNRCVSYRCRVKLVAKTKITAEQQSDQRRSGQRGPIFASEMKLTEISESQTLRLVKPGFSYKDKLVLAPTVRHWFVTTSRWKSRILCILGFMGFVFTILSMLCIRYVSWNRQSLMGALYCIASAFTVLFCLVCFSCYQLDLFQRLVCSFDFIFLSVQLSIAHVCICDFLHWDLRCFVTLSVWIWIHLALMLDALTPKMRYMLHLRPIYVAPVLISFIISQLLFCYDLAFGFTDPGSSGSSSHTDHVLWSISLFGRDTAFRFIPIFFGRVGTLSLWSARVLWKVMTRSSDDDLIMIQGNVEFYVNPHAFNIFIRHTLMKWTTRRILPAAAIAETKKKKEASRHAWIDRAAKE